MVQKLQLARRLSKAGLSPESPPPWHAASAKETVSLSSCEHRTAAKDGRIICSKITEGDNEVSPNLCRECPYREVNCSHLRFSLNRTSPSPLIVRYNGRTEIWDDGPSELSFEHAACAAKVIPIYEPRSCVGCTQCKPVQAPARKPAQGRKPAAIGKVVAFPSHKPVAVPG
jgi:hypothetical protein